MTQYTTKQGDTWDAIAVSVYGDRKYTEYLMSQNQSEILIETVIFDAGAVIATPDLPQNTQEDGVPPWRTS